MAAAREYPTTNIRNVVFLGHGGSGKSSLIDALCWVSGTTKRHEDPASGHSVTMHAPEEAEHGISIQLTPAYAEWMDTKLNLLDTPGYLDFTGETLAAVRVADAAVICIGATTGVEVGTEKVWEYCEARGIPRILFVSQMDRENADFRKVFRDVKAHLTDKVIPVEVPIGEGEDFHGIINLFSKHAHHYKQGTRTGEYEHGEIPDELRALFETWETELQERLATTDETYLEHYLEGGELSREEVLQGMAVGMARGEIVPLFCGSGKTCYGTRALLKKMVELFPNPGEIGEIEAQRAGLDQAVALRPADDEDLSALIFKTTTEPHVGELSYFRVFSGSLANGDEVVNASNGATEKLGHLSIPMGKERVEVSRLHAGDIGVVAKLKHTHTNDTLCRGSRPVELARIQFPKPDIAMALRGVTRSDEDKLGEVLPKLHEEDPTFHAEFDGELHQTLARGLGELHLEVQLERLKRKYNVAVETEQPRIAYRETISRQAEGRGRHKKQSGGRGQFGDCHIRIAPLDRGAGYEFIDSIKGGVIPGKFVPSVDRGIQEAAGRGVLAGYPLVDFSAEVFDGSYHSVDSSDIAFKIAGAQAFRRVAETAGPRLLEPIMEVRVTTPEEYMGDVMGDINQRRGRVAGMESADGRATITAHIPEAELYRYASALRAMTQGRAHHVRTRAGYEFVPEVEARKIIAAREEERAQAS
ncbi:MAG TPA: elongation factor G [Longimicrobiales bacterium]|nr:elongation factor G [Longimicrobiales bacterium]